MMKIIFIGFLLLEVGIKGDDEVIPKENMNLTSGGLVFDHWDPSRVIDGNNRTDADNCSCCTAINRPAWIAIELLQPYPLTRIQVFGRTDKEQEQSQNIHLCVGRLSGDSCDVLNIDLLNTPHLAQTIYPTRIGQFINVSSLQSTQPMTICEIKVYRLKGFSLFKGDEVITMRKEYIRTNGVAWANMDVSRAIDGNMGTREDTCQCCAAIQRPAWIEVNFTRPHLITRIVVLGRTDLESVENHAQSDYVRLETALQNGTFVSQPWTATVSFPIKIVEFNPPKIVQIFRIQGEGTNYMAICEIIAYEQSGGRLFGWANQSSTYVDGPTSCIASNALNGLRNSKTTLLCTECSVTQNANSTWEVDLGGIHLIQNINVYGRFDNNSFQTSYLQVLIRVELQTNPQPLNNANSTIGLALILDPPRLARYVEIQQWTKNQNLALCEVEIIPGACHTGSFGDRCSHNCHCAHDCDSVTGDCTQCLPGWKPNTCSVQCDDGKYGLNCANFCSQHCYQQHLCNKSDGECIDGCQPGYDFQKNRNCTQECDDGKYGLNCSRQCSNYCVSLRSCEKENGTCISGCLAGYATNDTTCNTECDNGTYGHNCVNTCSQHCINTHSCNKADGSCIGGCLTGYSFLKDKTCNTECDHWTYGLNCTNTCSQHCIYPYSCNKEDGACNGGCRAGYDFVKNTTCNQDCDDRKYGINCSRTCSEHCSEPYKCNKEDGTCLGGCISGYDFLQDPTCALECSNGTYGLNCSHTCSQYCSTPQSCHNTDGTCIRGCSPGYDFQADLKCTSACDKGTFGQNCSVMCHCRYVSTCDHVSGNCSNGQCSPGWIGSNCSTECDSGFYGTNCTSECHCRNDVPCNHENGSCLNNLCSSGWKGQICNKECDPGHFGIDCLSPCHCQDNLSCHHIYGTCSNKHCAAGWIGDNCSTACENGTYGENCATDCNCQQCHHVNGSCTVFAKSCFTGYTLGLAGDICTKCNPGWYGDNCSMECHCDDCQNVNGSCASFSISCHHGFHFENGLCKADDIAIASTSSAAIGGGFGAAVSVILVIAVVVILIRRRHMLKRHTEQHDTAEMTDISKSSRSSTAHDNNTYTNAVVTKYENPDVEYYSFKSLVPGIKVHLLWDYIRENTKSGSSYFADEFSKLPSGLIHKHDVASSPENKGKTRYREMFAYDHSRVSLTKDKSTDSEYINACYIHGFEKVNKFIASQGPTEKMIDDFWRMVWQQRVEKIAMLTNLTELGTLKCLQYWPEELDSVSTYGDVNVKYIGAEETYDYIIRTLNINKGKETRLVKQFHLKTWPDKDVPDTTWCLLDFWRAVDTNVSSNATPIVVHCSAGVGRTGTFIALDNLIIQGRMEGSVRPFPMVEALRQQRVSMVQTKEQYVYLHEALADALLMGTHHVLTRQFENVYEYMIGKGKGSSITRMDEQFDIIMRSVEDSAIEVCQPASSEPLYGNVYTATLEIDAYRPQLMRRGSKFIQQLGTIFLHAIGNTKALLVCMSPTDKHLEEFWSLVEEQHVTTVISLAAPGSTAYETCQYLGARGSGRVGQFSVNYIHEKKTKGSVDRTFSFRDENHEDDDYLTTIKQFQLTSWLEGHDTPSDLQSFLDLIEEVLKWQPHLSDKRPILIHCQTGFIRCGLTALVLNEIQRIRKENGQINNVESVKTMKTRCRDLIQNKTQYRFCYEAMLTYIKNSGTYQNL